MSQNGWQAFLKGTRFDKYQQEEASAKPLWTVNLESDDAIVEWHKKVNETTQNVQDSRVATYIRNRNLYAGIHCEYTGRISLTKDPLADWYNNSQKAELIINHCYELTEQWVAKLSAFSADVEVLPVNTEESDRNNARASQRYADDLADKNDFKGLFLRLIRDSKIGGETYLFVDYDEHKGDIHPDAKKANDEQLRIPLKDPKGKVVLGDDGTPLMVDTQKKVGDLVYRLRSVPEVLVQPKSRWTDVEWIREVELVDVDELKVRYPDKAGQINDSLGSSKRSGSSISNSRNDIFVYTYWHKGVRQLDRGRKIVMLDDAILENGVHPFSGAPLNVVRLTDVDIEGELHGWSFLNNIAPIQMALNKLYTMYYTNIALGSHLYWLIHASSRVAKDRIRNAASVIQWHGVHKPEIATFRTVASEIPSMIEKLEQRIMTISRIQATSRGELPANVEAGVAIKILEEQEEQSAIPDVKKVNAAIEKLYSLSLGIAGDKYDKSDGRTARILGADGEYLMEIMDTAKLSGPYDVKAKKTTALSKSKAMMTQEITQLLAMKPDIFSSEEVYDLLQLGDRDKFYDNATAAKRTADLENMRMRQGDEVADPKAGEYHLVHWRSHMMELQTPSFKMKVAEDIREYFEDHLGVTEMLLVEQAKKNIKIATELAQEDYFPSFYVPDFSIPEILAALQRGDTVPLMGEAEMEEEAMPPEAMAGDPGMEQDMPPQEQLPLEQMPESLPEGDMPMADSAGLM